MDAKTLELMLINTNRVLSLVYQAMDLDGVDREPDHYAEELRLEERSYKHDRY